MPGCGRSLAWSVGRAEVAEIDRLNILQASLLAMQRAVLALPRRPGRALIDGNRPPSVSLDCEIRTLVGGDALEELPNEHELYSSFFVFDDGPALLLTEQGSERRAGASSGKLTMGSPTASSSLTGGAG